MADANFDKRVLLLHCDGADNGTTFTDSSRSARIVTRNGNTCTKTGTKKYGTASAYFDGSGDYLAFAADANLALASGDFTVEFWVNANTGGYRVIGTRAGSPGVGWLIAVTPGTSASWLQWTAGNTFNSATGPAPTANTWTHIAVCRVGDVVTVYTDGVGGTPLDTANRPASASNILNIGRDSSATTTEQLAGYLDEIRFTTNHAEYTANFTPPSAAFQEYQKAIFGTLTEDSAITDWRIRTHRVDTGALLSEIVATSSPYECPCGIAPNEYTGLVTVSCLPKIDGKWVANTAYSLGAYITPTNPVTTPYVFKCTTAGTSHATTEPTWDTTPGNTTEDGSAVWTCQDRLVQPILHGPLLPQLPS